MTSQFKNRTQTPVQGQTPSTDLFDLAVEALIEHAALLEASRRRIILTIEALRRVR